MQVLFDGFTCGLAEEIRSFFEGMNLEAEVTEESSLVQKEERSVTGEE